MSLFRKKTPEERAAEARERQRRIEAEKARRIAEEQERQRQIEAEKARKALEEERTRRIKTAKEAIEDFYIREAPKWEYFILKLHFSKGEWQFLYEGTFHSLNKLSETLNNLGSRGWELVGDASDIMPDPEGLAARLIVPCTMDRYLFFKRPKPPLPSELAEALRDAEAYGRNQSVA